MNHSSNHSPEAANLGSAKAFKAPPAVVGGAVGGVVGKPIKSSYDGNELFASLLKDYAEALATRVSDLQAAVEGYDWKDATDLAHKMNGSAATYGYPILSKHAAVLERLTRQAHAEGLVDLQNIGNELYTIRQLCARIVAGA